ncbi:MAG: ribosome recycling factor [Maricaulis sp.]|jgi:ribosome recycling factor|uniref:ribosome recycling factor n=1 Tax=Maricaulis sp. TaxID=1486257 RepID=UPI001B2B9BD7|nr:ribosome recycling factor [Maricaulis sp.]MBO6846578.1 ribosome recycling factor [Maricaulis sp.]MBO6877185.1 ribosome recycling factor [Maricaulis sp.]MDM7982841.1 ribosome recycling factor [Maricaulis sp.]
MSDYDEDDLKRRMDGAIESLRKEFAGLRTGRASANLLDPIKVEAYGTPTPINQVGTVSVPEPRMISVQIWDKEMVGAVDKAIRNSQLGLNPVVEGQLLRIPIPPLNEERRAELAKLAGSYAENARVAVRNVRRDGMDGLKKLEKDGTLSEDEHKSFAEDVQKLTNDAIKKIDENLKTKQEEIMQV